MKDLLQFGLQAGASFVIAILLLNVQKDYINRTIDLLSKDKEKERDYLLEEVKRANRNATKERDAFRKERQEFKEERQELMDSFLLQLSKLSESNIKMSNDIKDVKETVNQLKCDVEQLKSK